MPMTFGDMLNQFALSTDIVDRDRFQRVMDMIDRYTKNALHIHTTKSSSPTISPRVSSTADVPTRCLRYSFL